jgi:GT2 family glycosyltransferase
VNPKVVFFVLNYNGLRSLGSDLLKFIDSVFTVNYPNYEVVIVDNSSSDGSYEVLKERYGGDALVIRLGNNYGYAGGNEFGLRLYLAHNGVPDYVILINNDYRIKNPDFLRDIVRLMERDKDVALSQGINLSFNKDIIASAGQFITNSRDYPRGIGLKLNELPEIPSYISHPHGSCIIIRVKAVLKHRPYVLIPSYFGYNEVAELGLSMWSLGYKSMFYPVLVGEHRSSSTFRSFSELRAYLRIRNELWMYREFLSKPLNIYLAPSFSTHVLAIPYRPLQGKKGSLFTRAVVDGFRMPMPIRQGSFYPLILILKLWESIIMGMPGAVKRWAFVRYVWEIEDRITRLTVTREMLKQSAYPFLIKLR